MWVDTNSSRPPSEVGEEAQPTTHASGRARRCVACGERVPVDRARRELLRFVLAPSGDGAVRPVIDLRASSAGRGAWVHPRQACLKRATAGGFARSARARVEIDFDSLVAEIATAARRRASSLLASAVRGGVAAIGSAAVDERAAGGGIALVIVASDARAAAQSATVRTLGQQGRVLPYGDKDELGAIFGRRELAVVAIGDKGLAAALRHAIGLTDIGRWADPQTAVDGSEAAASESGLTPHLGKL
jgi:predicted RNA-binding protein YlxR (DUF448 family)/ribosomal protein L30E